MSLQISVDIGSVRIMAHQYDEAISACNNVISENPTFPHAHGCLAEAYWRKRMYAQSLEEHKASAQLSGDRDSAELTSAVEQGFRSA
jgi:predicted Zn-dependent protease